MAFIDPKEKTMEVILTQHGRHLLSKGRLIVKYYAFHDDEIDYQAQFNDQTSFYTPANLGSRLLLWLKDSGIFSSPADVWVNEPTALGGGVFTGSSTARPTVTTVNGINSLLFDGVNDQLTGSLNANAYVTTSSFEGAMVVQISSLGTANNSSDTTPYVRPAIIELITGAQIGVDPGDLRESDGDNHERLDQVSRPDGLSRLDNEEDDALAEGWLRIEGLGMCTSKGPRSRRCEAAAPALARRPSAAGKNGSCSSTGYAPGSGSQEQRSAMVPNPSSASTSGAAVAPPIAAACAAVAATMAERQRR
jgi:hypothetical protein